MLWVLLFGTRMASAQTAPLAGLACFTGALCALPLLYFIIVIVIMIWVYKDAEKRGKSGALWLIIVLFTGIIGIIVWLIVRPPIVQYPPQYGYQPPPPPY